MPPADHMPSPEQLDRVQALLFDRWADEDDSPDPTVIFVLGSPRTGSTLLFQVIINHFRCAYLPNIVNDCFPHHPIVGSATLRGVMGDARTDYASDYGKTSDPLDPSEASAVHAFWFGGEHPSQIRSRIPMPGREDHLVRSVLGIATLAGRPLVLKNAWNCFRVPCLASLFPTARFAWIRRDIVASARSDLEARLQRDGPDTWNSATTANYLELQRRPCWEQVVEQQYEYNIAIEQDLRDHAEGRCCEVWYEDLCEKTAAALGRMGESLFPDVAPSTRAAGLIPTLEASSRLAGWNDEDTRRIEDYARSRDDDRFASHFHADSGDPSRPCNHTAR